MKDNKPKCITMTKATPKQKAIGRSMNGRECKINLKLGNSNGEINDYDTKNVCSQ